MPMLEQQAPIIAPEQLAKLIGEARFEALRSQLEQFKIDIQEHNKQSASAIVEGFEVKLTYRGNNVEGACNCPESDGFDFCIHCAALCLLINRNIQQISSLAKGPDKSKVLAYLLSQDKQHLAKEFLALINDDSELFERYVLRASLNQGELDYASLKSQITDLTRKPEKLFSQRQVKLFFAKIERFVNELNALKHYSEPEKMLKLVEYLYQRLNRLLDEIDDNSGQRSDCVTTFRSLYQKLLLLLHGREETKAKRFFKLWIDDTHSIFPSDIESFLERPLMEKFLAFLLKINKDLSDKKIDYSSTHQEQILRFLLDNFIKKDEPEKVAKIRSQLDQLRRQ
jgi:uncharacterized Zn finger protein